GGVLLAIVMPLLVIAVWWTFASPKAPRGGPVVRPVTKVLVFGLAGAGLWAAGHHGWAIVFLVFSVVVNALAQLPQIRTLVPQATGRAPGP
ncbi:MAG: YrdB family protein, partial [Pedococcus sp.]